jgi:hypothetical protein
VNRVALFSTFSNKVVNICILYNQRDATYTMFFIIIGALHVSGGFSAHHQELIKLYVQPWVLSCFPAVYRWCGLVPLPKAVDHYFILIIGLKIVQ